MNREKDPVLIDLYRYLTTQEDDYVSPLEAEIRYQEVEIDDNYCDNNIEFTRSWNYILDRLGVCFDSQTGNFVTQDTGDVI